MATRNTGSVKLIYPQLLHGGGDRLAEGYKRIRSVQGARQPVALGMSLGRANQKQNACAALAQLTTIRSRRRDQGTRRGGEEALGVLSQTARPTVVIARSAATEQSPSVCARSEGDCVASLAMTGLG